MRPSRLVVLVEEVLDEPEVPEVPEVVAELSQLSLPATCERLLAEPAGMASNGRRVDGLVGGQRRL